MRASSPQPTIRAIVGRRDGDGSVADQRTRVIQFLERKAWPTMPKDQLGRRLTREEEDAILGYGSAGV